MYNITYRTSAGYIKNINCYDVEDFTIAIETLKELRLKILSITK